MQIDLDRACTQAEFSALVGVSQQAVSSLIRRAVLPPGATCGAWLIAYTSHLREMAAGRGGEVGQKNKAETSHERALLLRAQREAQEMKNSIARGEYAPIEILGDCLAKIVEMMVASLDQIDGAMAKAAPDLPEPARLAVLGCVVDARNKVASRGALGLVIADIDPEDDIDANDSRATQRQESQGSTS